MGVSCPKTGHSHASNGLVADGSSTEPKEVPVFEFSTCVVALNDDVRGWEVQRFGSQIQGASHAFCREIGILRQICFSDEYRHKVPVCNCSTQMQTGSHKVVEQLCFEAWVSWKTAFRLVHSVYNDGQLALLVSRFCSELPIMDSVFELRLQVLVI